VAVTADTEARAHVATIGADHDRGKPFHLDEFSRLVGRYLDA
jgi:hypothetical protein